MNRIGAVRIAYQQDAFFCYCFAYNLGYEGKIADVLVKTIIVICLSRAINTIEQSSAEPKNKQTKTDTKKKKKSRGDDVEQV